MSLQVVFFFSFSCRLPSASSQTKNVICERSGGEGEGKERLFGDSTKKKKERRCEFQRAGSISVSPWQQELGNRPSSLNGTTRMNKQVMHITMSTY